MQIAKPLLKWYHEHRRVLPFREDPQPYHVWVSEIMLQQTQMVTVLPYYERFMAALPDVAALAACDEEKLHKLWEGLGYYSRARNLQKAARLVMEQHGGAIPGTYEELLALPGIGPYTAGAVASIAFGRAVPAVDGNVLRVFARLLDCREDVTQPAAKAFLTEEVRKAIPPATPGGNAPGDFNQALMELGALVCVPAAPRSGQSLREPLLGPHTQGPAAAPHCGDCPLAALCQGCKAGTAATLPVKAAPKPKKEIPMCVLVMHRPAAGGSHEVLLCRRPAKGLLAGLWGPVTLEGDFSKAGAAQALEELIPGARILSALPKAKHVFTHRVWQMYGWLCEAPPGAPAPENHTWAAPGALRDTFTIPGAFAAYLPAMSKTRPVTEI